MTIKNKKPNFNKIKKNVLIHQMEKFLNNVYCLSKEKAFDNDVEEWSLYSRLKGDEQLMPDWMKWMCEEIEKFYNKPDVKELTHGYEGFDAFMDKFTND